MSIRIVFNTRYSEAACSIFYRDAFASLNNMAFSDWDNYDHYDIALFMTYERDIKDLVAAKRKYPNLKVGLIDPRGSQVVYYLKYVDFLVVDSLEMKDFFAGYQLPMFQYYEYPNIENRAKKHIKKERIIIGYHGNIVHIAGMYPNVTVALERLSEEFKIELWAMYNIKTLGECSFGLPNNMQVKHIQWSEENYHNYLSKADLGIVPNLMPIKNINQIKKKAQVCRSFFNDSPDDYLIRFKMPSNPGRIIIFGKMGIPVVTDFYPSALQFIQDEHNGMLACSAGGWYCALEKLICNHSLRQKMADNMFQTIKKHFDFEIQNKNLMEFLVSMMGESKKRESIIIEKSEETLLDNSNFKKSMLQLKARGKIISSIRNGLKIKLKQWCQKRHN